MHIAVSAVWANRSMAYLKLGGSWYDCAELFVLLLVWNDRSCGAAVLMVCGPIAPWRIKSSVGCRFVRDFSISKRF